MTWESSSLNKDKQDGRQWEIQHTTPHSTRERWSRWPSTLSRRCHVTGLSRTSCTCNIGKVKVKSVELEHDSKFRAVLHQCYPVPYLHQELNQHLTFISSGGRTSTKGNRWREEEVGRDIRMNLDVRQLEMLYRMKTLFGSVPSSVQHVMRQQYTCRHDRGAAFWEDSMLDTQWG